MFLCEVCGKQMVHGRAGQVHCFACGRTDSTWWKCAKCQVTFEILPNSRFRCSRCGRIITDSDLAQQSANAKSFFQRFFSEFKNIVQDMKFGLIVLRSLRR